MFLRKLTSCIAASAIFLSVALFCSCDCNLSVVEKKGGYKVSYSAVLGAGLLDTVGALSDDGSNDGSEVIFSPEEIQNVFRDSGLANVKAESVKAESLAIEAETAADAGDFISKAGIINGDKKSFSLLFTKENLAALYDGMPGMMKSYIDMFMAPAFSGEEMPDEEYIDLVASVYGEVVAEEIKNSKINLTLTKLDGKKQKYSVRLLDLINIKKQLVYKI